jgi:hypothetical protein
MIRLDLKYSTLDFFFKKENKLLPDQVELDANSADSQRFWIFTKTSTLWKGKPPKFLNLEQLGPDLLQIQGRDKVECIFLFRSVLAKGCKEEKGNNKKRKKNCDFSGKKVKKNPAKRWVGVWKCECGESWREREINFRLQSLGQSSEGQQRPGFFVNILFSCIYFFKTGRGIRIKGKWFWVPGKGSL